MDDEAYFKVEINEWQQKNSHRTHPLLDEFYYLLCDLLRNSIDMLFM
jgi:hypothetical protein